jgi:hypothetical protein
MSRRKKKYPVGFRPLIMPKAEPAKPLVEIISVVGLEGRAAKDISMLLEEGDPVGGFAVGETICIVGACHFCDAMMQMRVVNCDRPMFEAGFISPAFAKAKIASSSFLPAKVIYRTPFANYVAQIITTTGYKLSGELWIT